MRRAPVILIALALLLRAAPAFAAATQPTFESSVVSLTVSYQNWDEDRPWAKKPPGSRLALAVVVEGPRLLTTAQMIAGATLIQVEKFGRPTRATARPVCVDREVDLALLAVDDPGFFAGLAPVRLVDATPAEGTVNTVRWKNGQLESSASRIQRFEVEESYFGALQHAFLFAQTDVSGGGWSEPVFAGERLTGLTVSQDEQTARVIPAEVLAAFLERSRGSEPYLGFPVLRLSWQVNEDPALAAFLGQTGEPRGVLVRQVPWGSSACGVLEPRDILLSIDGKPIDASGYYAHPRLGQLGFPNIVFDGHRIGDVVPVVVLRGGKQRELRMALRDYPAAIDRVPDQHGDGPPPYVIAGGFVFRELDGNYLRTWGSDWTKKAPLQLVAKFFLDRSSQQPGRRHVVILSAVLPAAYNIGYQDLHDLVVDRINGRPVDGVAAVVEALRHPENGFHTISFEPSAGPAEAVLDAATLATATTEILSDYRVPAAMRLREDPSPDPGPPCTGSY